MLVVAQLLRSFPARSPSWTFWEVDATTNLRLVAVVANLGPARGRARRARALGRR